MQEVEQAFTPYQIDRAQTLKRVSDNYEMCKSFLELNKKPISFEIRREVGEGEVPLVIADVLVLDNRFVFGQYLARRSLMQDLIREGMEEDVQEITERAREKYIGRKLTV